MLQFVLCSYIETWKYLKIKSPITSLQSSLFLWFLWPIKKVFILLLFSDFYVWHQIDFFDCAHFSCGAQWNIDHLLAADCVLTPKKNLLIHSDRYLYILAWLNDPIMVGRVRQIGQSYYWAALSGGAGCFVDIDCA